MRIAHNSDAVSTLTLIILLLCSAVLGGIISYLVVMTNYYNMPEDTTLLVVENVTFPVFDARYFNVTILNPSNSASDANITAIHLIVQGQNEVYNVTTTEPVLPYLLRRGTKQTFRCTDNWSEFAGERVKIEPVAANTSTSSSIYTTPKVKLTVTPSFDPSQSVEYFNLTVKNSPQSVINLTVSKVYVFGQSITEKVTPLLPLSYSLPPGEEQALRCNWTWKDMGGLNISITVKTLEGFESTYKTRELPGAFIHIQEIEFDYSNPTYFSVTFNSSEDSSTEATISQLNVTLEDETTIPIEELLLEEGTTIPLGLSLLSRVPPKNCTTLRFPWNWTGYRNKKVTVNAYTREGFSIPNMTLRTPNPIVWNITGFEFDLRDLEHFSINVTNTKSSLQNITITRIQFNENQTDFDPQTIPIGNEARINCTFDWTKYKGHNVSITVHAANVSASKNVTLPRISLAIVDACFETGEEGRRLNLTVRNSNESLSNVTIARVTVTFGNENILDVDGIGAMIKKGENTTLTFSWDWRKYGNLDVRIGVYTTEGLWCFKKYTVPIE